MTGVGEVRTLGALATRKPTSRRGVWYVVNPPKLGFWNADHVGDTDEQARSTQNYSWM